MLGKFVNKITQKLIFDNVIDSEDADIYYYGIELSLMNLCGITVSIIIGIIFQMLIEAVVFLLAFIITRRFTGGYHADSSLLCLVITSAVISIVLTLVKICTLSIITCFLMGLLSFLIIVIFAPIENKNKPLSISLKKRCKKISTLLILVQNLASYIFWAFNIELYEIVSFAMLFVAISIILSVLTKGGRVNGEKDVENDC